MLKGILSYIPVIVIGIIALIPAYYNDARVGTSLSLLFVFAGAILQHHVMEIHRSRAAQPIHADSITVGGVFRRGSIRNPPSLPAILARGLLYQALMLGSIFMYSNLAMLVIDAETAPDGTQSEAEWLATDGAQNGIEFLNPALISQYADFDTFTRIYLFATLICMIVAYARRPRADGEPGGTALGTIVALPAWPFLVTGSIAVAILLAGFVLGWLVNVLALIVSGNQVFFTSGTFGEDFPLPQVALLFMIIATHVILCYAGVRSCCEIRVALSRRSMSKAASGSS